MPVTTKTKSKPIYQNYLQQLQALTPYGVFALRAINAKGKVIYTRYGKNIGELMTHIGSGANYYIMMNKSKCWSTKKSNIKYLSGIWLDLDLKRLFNKIRIIRYHTPYGNDHDGPTITERCKWINYVHKSRGNIERNKYFMPVHTKHGWRKVCIDHKGLKREEYRFKHFNFQPLNSNSVRELMFYKIFPKVLKLLPRLLKEAGLPEPTAINCSGYGFHLIYLFNKAVPLYSKPRNLSIMWTKTMQAFLHRFNRASQKYLRGIGIADPAAISTSKIMRIPMSYNVKYGHKVLCRTLKYTGKSYDFFSLYRKYAQHETKKQYREYRKHAQAKYDAKGKKLRKEHKSKRTHYRRLKRFKESTIFLFKKNGFTRAAAVKEDIRRHVKLCHGDINGHTEYNMFIYALATYFTGGDVPKALNDLNRKVTTPLNSTEITKLITESQQDYFKRYHFTNQWLISKLGINKNEMPRLLTLINHHEKRQRGNKRMRIRRHKASISHGAKRTRRIKIKKVHYLHQHNLSTMRIANKLGISRRSVNYYLKHK